MLIGIVTYVHNSLVSAQLATRLLKDIHERVPTMEMLIYLQLPSYLS